MVQKVCTRIVENTPPRLATKEPTLTHVSYAEAFMFLVDIMHRTTYSYSSPVVGGEHRLMLRAREGSSLKVVSSGINLLPGGRIQKGVDAYGNALDVVTLDSSPTTSIEIVSSMRAIHTPRTRCEVSVAQHLEIPRKIDRGFLDRAASRAPEALRDDVADWADEVVGRPAKDNPFGIACALSDSIFADFRYRSRHEKGTQTGSQTLSRGTGSCRDFAELLAQAARSRGLPALFASGYLYPAEGEDPIGGGSTHAWTRIHCGGAGWVDFDPTNGTAGGESLILCAVTATPGESVPVEGEYFGRPGAYAGMVVDVTSSAARIGEPMVDPGAWHPPALVADLMARNP